MAKAKLKSSVLEDLPTHITSSCMNHVLRGCPRERARTGSSGPTPQLLSKPRKLPLKGLQAQAAGSWDSKDSPAE